MQFGIPAHTLSEKQPMMPAPAAQRLADGIAAEQMLELRRRLTIGYVSGIRLSATSIPLLRRQFQYLWW